MKVHCCVAAYISDYAFLGTALLPHRQYRIKFMVSLDHSMWFHASFRADHWMLYECESPWAGESSLFPGDSCGKGQPCPSQGVAGHGLTVPLCRRVPGTGAGTAVAQGRDPGCHLCAGRSHQGGANAKPEQALAEEAGSSGSTNPLQVGAQARQGGTPGPKQRWARQDPRQQQGEASKETGLDPALQGWGATEPSAVTASCTARNHTPQSAILHLP